MMPGQQARHPQVAGLVEVLERRHHGPAKLREQPDGGLLDQLVLGVGVGHLGYVFERLATSS